MKRILAMIMLLCFVFSFSLLVDATGALMADSSLSKTKNAYTLQNISKFDLVTGEKDNIAYSSIPRYSEVSNISYEIPEVSESLNLVTIVGIEDGMTLVTSEARPCAIIDSGVPFSLTPPTTYPHSGVVYVTTTWSNNGISLATGFLVSPNVVVTCAHAVISLEGLTAREYKIYPFYNSDVSPIASTNYVGATIAYVNEDGYRSSNIDEQKASDWAILLLDEEINGAFNFAYSYLTPALANESVAITGYPRCLNIPAMGCLGGTHENCPANHYLATSYGQFGWIGNEVYYTNNTLSGMSGAPVYGISSRTCYAIHANQYPGDGVNGGTIITEDIFNTIAYIVISNL